MQVSVRPAGPQDLDAVTAMFTDAVAGLRAKGIDQWDEIYPARADLAADIEKQQLTLAFVQGRLAAAWVLNRVSDPQYANGRWQAGQRPYLVLHRLCVAPAWQGRGVGSRVVGDIIEQAAQTAGAQAIRLDAFVHNPISRHMYKKLGYKEVGCAHFRKGEFVLMEKLLQPPDKE